MTLVLVKAPVLDTAGVAQGGRALQRYAARELSEINKLTLEIE
jgi:hypothetical protein